MKIKAILDDKDTDIVPPEVWRQVKLAIYNTGLLYGLRLEFAGDADVTEELTQRWLTKIGAIGG